MIGMPCSGKSTVSKIIASRLGYGLLDVDEWIVAHEQVRVAETIKNKGVDYVLALDEQCVREHDLRNLVVSTPGCAVYTSNYEKLANETMIFYLETSLEDIRARLAYDPDNERGVIGLSEKGIDNLYAERTPLYEEWAEYTIVCEGKDPQMISEEITGVWAASNS